MKILEVSFIERIESHKLSIGTFAKTFVPLRFGASRHGRNLDIILFLHRDDVSRFTTEVKRLDVRELKVRNMLWIMDEMKSGKNHLQQSIIIEDFKVINEEEQRERVQIESNYIPIHSARIFNVVDKGKYFVELININVQLDASKSSQNVNALIGKAITAVILKANVNDNGKAVYYLMESREFEGVPF